MSLRGCVVTTGSVTIEEYEHLLMDYQVCVEIGNLFSLVCNQKLF